MENIQQTENEAKFQQELREQTAIPKNLEIPNLIEEKQKEYNIPEITELNEQQKEYTKEQLLELLKKWDKLFSFYSYNNPEYSRACLHLIIGQTIRDCRIKRSGTWTDPRISILYLKPTFSGGSAGYDIVAKVGRELELMVETVADTSDAALIGSVDKVQNPEWEEGSDVPKFIIEQIAGLLDKSKSHVVYWGEPSMLFKKNLPPFQVKLRNYIQSALNPIDSEESKIRKVLKYGTSECDCQCSLMFVTFNPTEIDDEILKSGFLQRFCVISKYLDSKGRGLNAMMDANSYLSKNFDSSFEFSEVISLLRYIQNKYKNKVIFEMNEEAANYLGLLEQQEFNTISDSDTTERTREHLNGIQASTTRKIAQYAMHHAVLRLDTKIIKEDIIYANDILKSQMDTVRHYLEDSTQHEFSQKKEDDRIDKVRNRMYSFMAANLLDDIEKSDVLDIIARTFKYSKNKDGKHTRHTYKIFESMITSKILSEDKNKKVKFIDVDIKLNK